MSRHVCLCVLELQVEVRAWVARGSREPWGPRALVEVDLCVPAGVGGGPGFSPPCGVSVQGPGLWGGPESEAQVFRE